MEPNYFCEIKNFFIWRSLALDESETLALIIREPLGIFGRAGC